MEENIFAAIVLQAFSTDAILKCNVENCFKIDGK